MSVFEQIGRLTSEIDNRINKRRIIDCIYSDQSIRYAAQQVGNTNQQEYKRQYENYFGKFDFGRFNLLATFFSGCDQLPAHQPFKLDNVEEAEYRQQNHWQY